MTDVPEMIVLSRRRAGEMLTSPAAERLTHLVSIGDPNWHRPDGFERVLQRIRLELEDIEDPTHGMAATDAHVEELLAFGLTMKVESVVLVHCEAGISRSTASAIILLTQMLGPGSEKRACEIVFGLVDFAHPNRRMLQLADDQLTRHGRPQSRRRARVVSRCGTDGRCGSRWWFGSFPKTALAWRGWPSRWHADA